MGIYDTILNMHPGLLVLLLALLVNVFSTLVYKKVTDQKEIKKLKSKQKDLQKEIKKLQSQPEKAMKKQKEMMELSGTLMKQSFKPMLYTMIPLLLLFAWLNSSLIYESLTPEQPFLVTAYFAEGTTGEVTLSSQPELSIQEPTKLINEGEAEWELSGNQGTYYLQLTNPSFDYQKKIIITDSHKYEEPVTTYDGALKKIEIGNDRLRPFGNFSLFGWKPGMLGAYILLSIASSFIIRKLFNVV